MAEKSIVEQPVQRAGGTHRQKPVRMKWSEFDLSREIRFDSQAGLTTFRDNRILLFGANAIGLLRQNLLDTLGWDQTRSFLVRFGYQNGYSDFLQMRLNYEFESETDLLAAGPIVHTYEGIVKATPTGINFDRVRREFLFTGVWTNSYEAEQHLAFNPLARQPVCWTLVGYASGWCTAFFGSPLLAMEPLCIGKGDSHCEWKIQPPDAWGEEAHEFIDALRVFWNIH